MDELLNVFGWAAAGPVLVVAVPLCVVGLWLRAAGRRRLDAVATMQSARRRVADVRGGDVTVEGTWHALAGADGLVEDDAGAAVLVARDTAAETIADGARVLACGCAAGEADDPRGSGYRGHARLPRVVVVGPGHVVTTDVALLERGRRRARLCATAGAALFSLALAAAAAASLVAWRANVYY